MKKVMITGSSSGLGHALAEYYLAQGVMVYGMSRRVPHHSAGGYRFEACDFSALGEIETALSKLLKGVEKLELVYLNAGTLGRIQDMSACSMEELKEQMDVNLWTNKVILDYLIRHEIAVAQVVAISSGASQSGSLGWNGYSLSKAALNMLVKLYAHEMGDTHLSALAPGLVGTPMLGSILDGNHDTERYTTVQRLRDSREEGLVQTPAEVAAAIDGKLELLRTFESGAYIDIRDL
jgi:benzil reductase ((S)-benzoin forming)